MRLVATLLLVAIVLQGTLAVTSKASQAKLMIEKINNNLQKTHLGRALKNMVTLASKLGYNFDQLHEAFDALKEQLLQRKQDATDLYAVQSAAHVVADELYNSQINQSAHDIEVDNQRLHDDGEFLAHKTQELNDAEAANASAHVQHDQAVDDLSELEAVYAYEVEEFRKADVLIDQAVAALQDAQSHFENAQIGDAFIQMKNQFVSFSQKLTEQTSKLSAKHQLFIKPVVQLLAQLKTNQSAIQNAIVALQDLKAYFLQAAADGTVLYINYKAYLEEAIGHLNDQISLFENEIIPGLQDNITWVNGDLEAAAAQLSADTSAWQAATDGLAEETAAFQNATDRYNAVVSRCDSEYQLVVQAQQIISDSQAAQE